MTLSLLTVRFRLPWAHSLKEKRMEVKSLLSRAKNRFNVSAAETGDQDLHQSMVLGFAFLSGSPADADSTAERILSFLEASTGAELLSAEKEFR